MIRCYIEEAAVDGLADEIYEDLEPRMIEKVQEASEILADEMRSLLKRKGPPRPGEPPAYVKGELHDSITTRPVKKSGRRVVGGAGSTDHAKAASLEYGRIGAHVVGTRKGKRTWKKKMVKSVEVLSRVLPFPFMRPAEERAASRMEAKLDEV